MICMAAMRELSKEDEGSGGGGMLFPLTGCLSRTDTMRRGACLALKASKCEGALLLLVAVVAVVVVGEEEMAAAFCDTE